ncbi:MAG: hypothetical protein C0602_06215 [Denitrovibrio sp.]|nr:MAG: hypothetical protein C0602_06215 [Denitrovibrio sp.]
MRINSTPKYILVQSGFPPPPFLFIPIYQFFGTLKNELVYHQKYSTRQETEAETQEYIEIFYNRVRRHASLGNLSPAAYTRLELTKRYR